MRLIFVNRYYWPDESATSLMLTDLATALAAEGREVTVLTSRQRIEDAAAQLPRREVHRGVTIERLDTTRFGRTHLIGRACDYLSFYLGAGLRLLQRLRRDDVVIAKTDPPLISVVAAVAAAIKRARLVNWLQDVYPEVAVRLGVPGGAALARPLAALRNTSLRRAAANVVVGERMRDFVAALLPGRAPPQVIHNWSQPLQVSPVPDAGNPYRRDLGLQDKIVFCYSGNLGRAHQFEGLIEAATQLRDDPRLHFLIIGSGNQTEVLKAEVRRRALGNWSFLPPQPREKLALSLGSADVHLVSLNPEMEGLIVPSKLYGILAAGRPCLFLGDCTGTVATVLQDAGCGLVAAPSDATAIRDALLALCTDTPRRLALGLAARAVHEARFAWPKPLYAWQAVLGPLDTEPPARSSIRT